MQTVRNTFDSDSLKAFISFRSIVATSLLCAAGVPATQAATRTFTDRNGRKVVAEVVAVADGKVTLKLANGQPLSVPLTQLSNADQSYLQSSAAASPSPTPTPTPNYFGETSSDGNAKEDAPVASATPEPTAAEAAPAGVTWEYDAKPRGVTDLAIAKFRVWIPDATKPVRGMLALVPGLNSDGREAAGDAGWQALARELGFGIVACQFNSGMKDNSGYSYAGNGSGKTLLEALTHFATEAKHPEVAAAPLLLWGMSAGGQFNYNFACWKPERTLGFVVNKGGFCYETPASPATRSTPAIIFVGGTDTPERVGNLKKLFATGRSHGALWSMCIEKGRGHETGSSREIAEQFFRSVVALRLPAGTAAMKHVELADGLLATPTGDALPAKEFKGSSRDASWLPDAATALAWKAPQ